MLKLPRGRTPACRYHSGEFDATIYIAGKGNE
jgi:hypothetical protein